MDDMLLPLTIHKSDVQSRYMRELCIQDEVCRFEISERGTYTNYICMGDEFEPANMKCRKIRDRDIDPSTRFEVTFRCNGSLFDDASSDKHEKSQVIHSCYYVGDNEIQIHESEHDSVTDRLACIRQKQACKLPHQNAIRECHNMECIVEIRAAMKKECNYQCNDFRSGG